MTSGMNRRRALLAGAALAAAASPAAAMSVMTAEGDTAIGKLWAQAQSLRGKLDRYSAEIAAAERQGGLPGWMRLKGEAYARSWLRGGATAMFTDRYVYVNQVGHDRLWRDLSNLINEHGVAIVVDDDMTRMLVDYMEANGITGGFEQKRRRA